MKRILVIGEHGYVASAFCKYMQKYPDYCVKAVSSRNHAWEKTDFSGYDVVFNASGLAHANAKQGTEADYYEVNGRLPIELAEKAKREDVGQFINISSSIVYGDISSLDQEFYIDETTVPNPSGVYGKSKLMAEAGLRELADDSFHVAILRPPLIYGEDAAGNFGLLVKVAMFSPIFPNFDNVQSMIYIDNLCELVRLIVEDGCGGMFYPQQREYIRTSRMVADMARAGGIFHGLCLTRLFNPVLRFASRRLRFIQKAFGNMAYRMEISNHFDWKYIVVDYLESMRRIAKARI